MSIEIEMKETLYAIHKVLLSILAEQKKIVEGNAAVFSQVRMLRMMEEKKIKPDDNTAHFAHGKRYCIKCNEPYYFGGPHRCTIYIPNDYVSPDLTACFCSKCHITYAKSSGCRCDRGDRGTAG